MEKNFYERLVPSDKVRAIINRLVKAFVFGAIGAMMSMTIVAPANWQEIWSSLAAVLFSCIVGGFTGVGMAVQKWWSWTEIE